MQRLKILFLLSPKIDADPIFHELVSRLAHGLDSLMEVEQRVSAHAVDSKELVQYDLVHVFGCWHTASIQTLLRTYAHRVPSVCSLLGGLQPWVIKAHGRNYALATQRRAIQQASAIHVCGKLEHELFGKLAWNKRTALIKNPVLTSQLTFENMAEGMSALYHKVLDTQARLKLSEEACRVIGDLMQLGVDRDVLLDKNHCAGIRDMLARLAPIDWRRIWLYAADEHISELLALALERLSWEAPQLNVDEVERFAPARAYADTDLQTDELCFKGASLLSKLKNNLKPNETNERRLCVAMLNFKHELGQQSAPMLHLANLYTMMRFDDTDEDRLKEVAAELGMGDFASRLMIALHTVMHLGEGFMPFVAIDDKRSRLLTAEITKFNTWMR